jgi:hypothetical protein
MPKMPCAFVNRGADARSLAFRLDMGERGGGLEGLGVGLGLGGGGAWLLRQRCGLPKQLPAPLCRSAVSIILMIVA